MVLPEVAAMLWSHSAHSHLFLSLPREPILENCPTTGQFDETPADGGPCSWRTYSTFELRGKQNGRDTTTALANYCRPRNTRTCKGNSS
jgi:hypothetical protein